MTFFPKFIRIYGRFAGIPGSCPIGTVLIWITLAPRILITDQKKEDI
jgi:hypothetical protein